MTDEKYDYVTVEEKWQKKWIDNKIYLSEKDEDKKFFIHFAYPGVSGYLHVGHMRGFTYCDTIARFKKMDGYSVLFPAGFHASGIPSIGFAKKVEREDPRTIKMLKDYGVEDDHIEKLTDPYEVVKYFGEVYVEDYWKKFGFLIDYSRIMSTISEGYKKFIQWQFHKLKENNLLIQKPHFAPFCPNCGPVAVDKSETDISRGGNAEIQEFTVIKFFLEDGTVLPAATLRPETIFGVTNMWINPNVEYIKAKVDDETWIISEQSFEKIKHQKDNIKKLDEKVKGQTLIGKKCKLPLAERKIPILSGPFADPNVATGIVMSVPAHAPYDWIALVESDEKIKPITIIDVKDFEENPAKEICEKMGIKSQNETEKLEKATEEVYKKEFHKGYLNENCRQYEGIKISEIKDEVKDELISNDQATIMREFSEEVICRCGKKVAIKKIPDQWFIKYSDSQLTKESKKHVSKMKLFPEEYREQLPKVLDWFDDRACIRKGSWLGTEFPFKKGWTVEPISDSTLYPAYYVVSKYINEDKIKPEEMNEDFFDYIFYGEGEPKREIWKKIKSDFDYWYPVDINLGGKEHKTVHFPVFIMNHVAVMPKEKKPRGIFVHWWVTQKGKEKISKSKGGAEHIEEAATKYGVDTMRLYYSHVGSPFVDVEWDTETVLKYKNKINNIYRLVKNIISNKKFGNKEKTNIDRWLLTNLNGKIKKIRESFDKFNLRIVSNIIYFEMQKDLQWYIKRDGDNRDTIKEFIQNWIRLMTPITPHISEELWHIEHDDFVSTQNYPIYSEEKVFEKAKLGESLLFQTIEDIKEIIKVTNIDPDKICIYTSPKWKWNVYRESIEMESENNLQVGKIMKSLMTNPELRSKGKKVSKFVGKLPGEIKKLSEKDKKRYFVDINEKEYLKKASEFLEKQFSSKIVIYQADEEDIYDPKSKSRYAFPLKPAIYIE
ncbi:MAG: leucine--tRNA ligase [Candidatus Thermoplasmatota archaeon]